MGERYGADFLNSLMKNDTDITDIVGTSIYEGLKVPGDDDSEETINFYRINPFNGGLEYFESRFSIDCRSKSYLTSRDLASNVFTAINREFATVNGKRYFAVCDILTTIPPVNDTDSYNTPVEVYLRRR